MLIDPQHGRFGGGQFSPGSLREIKSLSFSPDDSRSVKKRFLEAFVSSLVRVLGGIRPEGGGETTEVIVAGCWGSRGGVWRWRGSGGIKKS